MSAPKIDFYIVGEDAVDSCAKIACKLAQKAYKQGHRVYLHTSSQASATQLDELLWTFSQGSFVPHQIVTDTPTQTTPVTLGYQQDPQGEYDVLINLTEEVPPFYANFPRIAEMVEPHQREQGRSRYRFYREQGYALDAHNL